MPTPGPSTGDSATSLKIVAAHSFVLINKLPRREFTGQWRLNCLFFAQKSDCSKWLEVGYTRLLLPRDDRPSTYSPPIQTLPSTSHTSFVEKNPNGKIVNRAIRRWCVSHNPAIPTDLSNGSDRAMPSWTLTFYTIFCSLCPTTSATKYPNIARDRD